MSVEVDVQESTQQYGPAALPLSHVSVEVGHFYAEDLARDHRFFREHFRRIARWLAAARDDCAGTVPGRRPRISTCLLIDDYFTKPAAPSELIPKLLDSAREGGLIVDYIARESGCADPAGVNDETDPDLSPAHLVEARLVDEPAPGSTGARPPARQVGWLCNGQRSPATARYEAMKGPVAWRPPVQNVVNNHSIFIDIELWNIDGERGRRWSCATLASVWQLLRLGMIRNNGRPVAVPQPLPDPLPDDWSRLPPVVDMGNGADAFSAYRTLTICDPQFLPVEHAVRTILERVAVAPEVLRQIDVRGGAEGLTLPRAVVDRIGYLFVGTGPVRDAGTG